MAPGDRLRLVALAAMDGVRAGRLALLRGPLMRWRLAGPAADRLVIAPRDMRTADATIASDIYSGLFVLAGQAVDTGGRSPFAISPPSIAWARALHGFGWLRHLRAADSAVARSNARALVSDWIAAHGRRGGVAWEPEVAARRLIAWLSQSPLILAEADHAFYRLFAKSLARHIRFLRAAVRLTPNALPRLRVVIALASAGLAVSNQARTLKTATRLLDDMLARQVLPDGGHISRNPGAVIELLAELLPLRQTFAATGVTQPASLQGAIDRMMPMLRFFRHGDGSFAHFNGMGATRHDLVATVLAYDDSHGQPPLDARHSGYQRLERGETVVILDAGPPPPPPASMAAHAGTLSFEMSAGGSRFVINCGVPPEHQDNWRRLARGTAAHSTVTIADASSSRFAPVAGFLGWRSPPIIGGPMQVRVARDEAPDGVTLAASHDGYRARFGVVHERRLFLSADGGTLSGEDRLIGARPKGGQRRRHAPGFAVRFHLHPLVRVSRVRGGAAFLIAGPNGHAFEFTTDAEDVAIEESVFLSEFHGHRRAEQIVIYGRLDGRNTVCWTFALVAAGGHQKTRREREAATEPGEQLPL